MATPKHSSVAMTERELRELDELFPNIQGRSRKLRAAIALSKQLLKEDKINIIVT
ncbi:MULTISPECIES: hypothetical protein [Leptolyngbya]|uniref:hypothetical protein n=1 Tax=Leptolyngbya TaxID=47251 RepID=UPI00168824B0|nr:hypothetical protein [Leptolyngbya sp. FACHB-1624]MBD1857721.1 hypothetical protein [Leptolyngbya sp. FACHB-1624]